MSLVVTGTANGVLAAGGLFTPEATQTSAYTAVPGDYVPVDTTGGAVTITLPSAPTAGTSIIVKMVAGGVNAVTIAAAGADVFNAAGGAATYTLAGLYQGVQLQYLQGPAVWAVLDFSGQLHGPQFQTSYVPKVVALTDATTIALNAALGNDFRVTLTGNHTLGAPTNPVDGQRVVVFATQDATGTRTLAYNAIFDWGTPGAPTLTTGPNKIDQLRFCYNANATKWLGEGTTLGF